VVIIEISTYALIFAATAWALEVDGKDGSFMSFSE
jgi:hypothetical protein